MIGNLRKIHRQSYRILKRRITSWGLFDDSENSIFLQNFNVTVKYF